MKAMNDWSENPEAVAKSCGIPVDVISHSEPTKKKTDVITTCSICFDDFDPKEMSALGCGHSYCSGSYIITINSWSMSHGCQYE